MDSNQSRRMTAQEKLGAVEEARQSGATISEACRCHQIRHTQFYRWERLTSEVSRLGAMVAELIAENLTLKRGLLGE